MDDYVERFYGALAADENDTQAKIAALQRHLSKLQKVKDGLRELYPQLGSSGLPAVSPPAVTENPPAASPPPDTEEGLRGWRSVVALLSEEPGRWWTTTEIMKGLADHGWAPQSHTSEQALRATRTSIGRALKRHGIESKELDGRSLQYRYLSNSPPSPAAPTASVPAASDNGHSPDFLPSLEDPQMPEVNPM